MRLKQRAIDGGWAPHFLNIYLPLGIYRFGGETIILPTAADAGRWASENEANMIILSKISVFDNIFY